MAPFGHAVLLGLALGGLVLPIPSFRINYKKTVTSSKLKWYVKSHFKCCKITEGTLYDSKKGAVPLQDKKCKQYKRHFPILFRTVRERDNRCTMGKYSSAAKNFMDSTTGKFSTIGKDSTTGTSSSAGKQEWTLLKAECLKNEECRNAPWCHEITLSKCYNITEGELSPWHYGSKVSRQDFPSGMAVSVAGKICQRNEQNLPPITYTHGHYAYRLAKLKITAVEMLGNEECQGDKWKHYGLEAAPECDDFGFWKQVLSTEGIKAPNWEASIAAAKTSSLEGMAWGTTMSDGATDDTLWNARRDTVSEMDDLSSSWS